MEFRGYQSTYVASLPAGRRHAAVPALRLAVPRAGEGHRARTPTTASRPPTSCATSCSACCARSSPSTAATAAAAHSSRVVAVRLADGRPASQLAWTDLPALRVDRADPSATWLAGRVARRRRASASRCSSRRREQTVEVQLAKARAAIDAVVVPARRRRCVDADPHRQPVGVAGGVAVGSRRAARSPTTTARRPRSTPCSARCRASWHRSSRSRSRASRPATSTSPSSCTRSARPPTPTTSRRRRSVSPGRASGGGDVPGALAALDLVAPTSGAYAAARRRRAELLTAGRARPRRARRGRGEHRRHRHRPARPADPAGADPRRRPRPGGAQRRPAVDPRSDAAVATEPDAADGGRARVPRAGDAHVRSGRADPARRRGQRRATPDARVSESSTRPWGTGDADLPAVRAGRRRRPTSSARRAARRSRGADRRGRRPQPDRRGRLGPRSRRRRRPPRARARAAARSTPTGSARRAGCGRRASATTSASSRRPTSRSCATRASCTPQRGRRRGRRRATIASCSSSATASPPRPTATSRRSPRPAPRATSSRPHRRRRRPRPAAVVEHWTEQLTDATAAARRTRRRVRRRRRRPGDNPPSCTFVAAVVDGPVLVAAWDGRQPLLLAARRRARDPGVDRRLVGHRADRAGHAARGGRGRLPRPRDHPLARRRQPRWRAVDHLGRARRARLGARVQRRPLELLFAGRRPPRAASASRSPTSAPIRSRSRRRCAPGPTNRAATTTSPSRSPAVGRRRRPGSPTRPRCPTDTRPRPTRRT